MISQGLVDEVKSLLKMGISGKCTSMQAIGYKELSAAIAGGSDIDTAIEKIKMESRRYAKRQLTWLRRDEEIKWIVREDVPDWIATPHKFVDNTLSDERLAMTGNKVLQTTLVSEER
jgi:tRNA dimethylallyltransferase